MDTRKILSNAVLYGLADAIVLVVGGFLLLPLYTRVLPQEQYGIYVIVRANIEIFTYLMYLGLPSAVGRVYFLYKKAGEHIDYLSSVVTFFILCFVVFGGALLLWGADLWKLLSPTTPVHPYLGFSLALATVGYFASIGTMWLRLDGRAVAFAALQVGAAAVLALCAVISLVVLHQGLAGLLASLLASSLCTALVLPVLFGRRFRLRINWDHIKLSMRYAAPILVGYVAYFILSRISTLILQRQVAVGQIAIYGLAQQLSMMVTIAATAFGMAMQPAVFAADKDHVRELLARSGKVLMLLTMTVTSLLLLFATEIFALVAPASYASGYEILLILLLANFVHAFSQISNTALLYHQRPNASAAVSILGAVLASVLGALLIPRFGLYGAAYASLGALLGMALVSHALARRIAAVSYFPAMLLSIAAVGALALLAAWLARQGWPLGPSIAVKAFFCVLIFAAIYFFYRKPPVQPCHP